jgi:N utilization substance protein B
MSSSRSARRRAREFALQGVYQWLLTDKPLAVIEEHMAQVAGFEKADQELFQSLLRGTLARAGDLRTLFVPFTARPIEELSPVEHAVLLMGAFELEQRIDVPYRVVINEAIELTKSYGGTDGYRFVNGVLDKLAASLRSAEVKAGQG